MSTHRGGRSEQESVELFDEHLITTRLRVQNIHDLPLQTAARSRVQNVEEQLVLFQKKVRDRDVLVLKNYILETHPNLIKLHLNVNKIQAEGAKVFAFLLEKDRSNLQELYLNRNYLLDEGTMRIAKALETNTKLRQLKLSENKVEDEGAVAIAEMLTKNHSLKGLEFDRNSYGQVGLGALANALNKNKGIRVFQVGESTSIRSRLQFVRMLIDTEDERIPRTSAVLCFSKDRNNDTLDLVLEEWRLCKREGKRLVNLPRELLAKFQKFNRFNEAELMEVHEQVKHFLSQIRANGTRNMRQGKILLMGKAGAGKTSLMRSLISGRSLLTGDGPDRATVSVQVKPWTVDQARCSIWDFGGQEEYYMTHSFFVTPRCIVVICVDLSKYDETEECYSKNVQYYVDSIQCHAPGAKFVIVGTKSDQVGINECDRKRQHIKEMFAECEAERTKRLDMEIYRFEGDPSREIVNVDSQNKNGAAEGDGALDLEGKVDEEGANRRVIKSHRLTDTRQFDEIQIDLNPPQNQNNHISASDSMKNSDSSGKSKATKTAKSIQPLLEVPHPADIGPVRKSSMYNAFMMDGVEGRGRGSIVLNEALDVEILDTQPSQAKFAQLKNNRATSSKFGRLLRRDQFESVTEKRDPREQVRLETLAKLKERRENRPFLIKVMATSSAGEIEGVHKLEQLLRTVIIKPEMFELSVELPKNYAKLYEELTGHSYVVSYDDSAANPNNSANNKGGISTTNALRRFVKSFSLKPGAVEGADEENYNGVDGGNKKQNGKMMFNLFKRDSVNRDNGSREDRDQEDGVEGSGKEKSKDTFGAIFKSNFRNGSKFKPIVQINDLYKKFTTNYEQTNTASKSKNKIMNKRLFNEPNDLHRALQMLHDIGYILWYKENEFLRDIVFVDPQWVVDMIKSVIRHNMFEEGEGSLSTVVRPEDMTSEEFQQIKDCFRETAVLDSRMLFCFDMWKTASTMERYHMLSLMESFDLLCEQPRKADRDKAMKLFVPVYLKSSFALDENNKQRMQLLEMEVINNINTVPKFARSLFIQEEGMTESQANVPPIRNSRTFLEDGSIRPKNIQWRYEFKNFFPEGLFLRLLVRCHPFISFHEQYKPTERFMVGNAALGVTIFLQEEREQYDIAGALILTAIQENVTQTASFKYNMNDIWQVFSLFAFEIEEVLSYFVGLETHVFVSFVNEEIGKVIIPRENLEVHELQNNTDPQDRSKRINIKVLSERIPLHYLIPPLYILPRAVDENVDKSKIRYTTPELVRQSKVARIEYGLLSVEVQLGEEKPGNRERVQILHKQLVKFADHLLTLLCELFRPTYGKIVRGFDQSLTFLKEQDVKEITVMETQILKLRDMEQSSFLYANNYLTPGHIIEGIDLCWKLFDALEKKLVIKEHEPSRKRKGMLLR